MVIKHMHDDAIHPAILKREANFTQQPAMIGHQPIVLSKKDKSSMSKICSPALFSVTMPKQ